MKIAVTCEDHQVFQHFGRTPEFAIFEIEEGKLSGMKIEPTGECGHGALVDFLKDRGVELLICGGIGGAAQQGLAAAGLKLVGGASGDVVEAVGSYLKGELAANPDFSCNHHHGGHEHACGHHHGGEHEHVCGPHGCGGH